MYEFLWSLESVGEDSEDDDYEINPKDSSNEASTEVESDEEDESDEEAETEEDRSAAVTPSSDEVNGGPAADETNDLENGIFYLEYLYLYWQNDQLYRWDDRNLLYLLESSFLRPRSYALRLLRVISARRLLWDPRRGFDP